MKLWKGNRVDGEYELSDGDILNGFFSSGYFNGNYTLDRGLLLYVSMKDGLNSMIDRKDADRLLVKIHRDERRFNR